MPNDVFNLKEVSSYIKDNPRSTLFLYKKYKKIIDDLFPNISDWKQKFYLIKVGLSEFPLCNCDKHLQFYRIAIDQICL